MKTNRIMSALLAIAVGFASLTSCSEDEEAVKGAVSLDVASAIMPETAQVRPAAIVVDGKGGTVTVSVSAGLPEGTAAQFAVTVADAPAWCHASIAGSVLTVVVDKSDDTKGRIASLVISATAVGAEISPLTVSVQQGEKVIPSGNISFVADALEAPASAVYTNGVVDLTYVGGLVSIPVTNDLTEPVEVDYAIEGEVPAWCVAAIVDGKLVVDVDASTAATVDQAKITVVGTGKTETVNLMGATLTINRAPFTSAMAMVFVKGGTYTMGDGVRWDKIYEDYSYVGREIADAKNYYKYPVTVDPFYIATTEITQKLYQQVMGTNPTPVKSQGDNNPVIAINWSMACEFCNALSEREGLTPAYVAGTIVEIPDPWGWGPSTKIQDYAMVDGANGYRLATSAEWEFAAKGGNEGIKAGSYVYVGGNEEADVMWYQETSKVNNSPALHEVAQKQANYLGLYDMSGNAAEWVYDWGTAYADRDARTAITDGGLNPTGAVWKSGMDSKVSRGGSYKDYDSKCYTHMETNQQADLTDAQGIRVVRSAK